MSGELGFSSNMPVGLSGSNTGSGWKLKVSFTTCTERTSSMTKPISSGLLPISEKPFSDPATEGARHTITVLLTTVQF